MVDLFSFGENRLAASVTREPNAVEQHRMVEVEALNVTPESAGMRFKAPLRLPKLRQLVLRNCQQSLLEMLTIDSLKQLDYLILYHSPDNLVDVVRIQDFPELKKLTVRQQFLDAVSKEWICRHQNLTHLALPETNACDATIQNLNCKQTLQRLDLFRSEVVLEDQQLRQSVFPELSSLDVSETRVSGASIEIIHMLFPRLGRLLAEQTSLTEVDVRQISLWKGLKILSTGHPAVDFDHHQQTFWP